MRRAHATFSRQLAPKKGPPKVGNENHDWVPMSYELMFWRQAAMMTLSSKAIYESLNENRAVDGLSDLPIEDMISDLTSLFPDAVRESNDSRESIAWFSQNQEDSFRATWSAQHFRVDCNRLPLNQVNEIVNMSAKYGCPLYDPQTGERFRLSS
jgi:hypothetical protein